MKNLALGIAIGIYLTGCAAPSSPTTGYQPVMAQQGKDVIWVPTPDSLLIKMLETAQVTSKDLVYDLGAGDGKIAIEAARRYGARAVGIEFDPQMADHARQNAKNAGVADIFIHAFTDGRDCDPKSGLGFIANLSDFLKGKRAKLASVIGRYFAMDRDKRWERVKLAYDLLVSGKGTKSNDLVASISESYQAGETDEFIKPLFAAKPDGSPTAMIQDGDVVLCFNFRTDRPREITQVLTQQDFSEFGMTKKNLYYVTMTQYDESYQGVFVLFQNDNLNNTLGEIVSRAGKSQIRIAETEKYPHVTFFFSGGRESVFPGEERLMVPSPKVPTYDSAPEMSAKGITELITEAIRNKKPDFICLNYANADMVGHTGDFQAAIKAVETVDTCLSDLVKTALENNYHIIVIADHGNSDYMINPDGTPNTAHTMNPVPIIYVAENASESKVSHGKLGDIAPTILHLLEIDLPVEMTGNNLISKK